MGSERANRWAGLTESTAIESQILLGRYRVLELLDVGGMGSVWLAEQLALRREVVVKFHESWSRAVDPSSTW